MVENLSVILQRAYYKAGKRKGVKQRLFKRTPIHDHFRTSMSLIEPGCTVKFTKPDQAVPRIKDYRPFLDCNDCIGSYNNYNAKNKIE